MTGEICVHGYFKQFCPWCSASDSYVEDEAKKLGIAYAERLPTLPILEEDVGERIWLASAIDHDGSIGETRTYIQRRVDAIYRYHYITPHVTYTTTTPKLAQKFYEITMERPTIQRRPPPRPTVYRFSITWRKAISIILYTKPHLIRLKETAEKVIEKYKERPAIPID